MRTTIKDLLAWGKEHSYPQLILSEDEHGHVHDYVKHGELHWYRMARSKERRVLAWKRIAMWQAYLERAS